MDRAINGRQLIFPVWEETITCSSNRPISVSFCFFEYVAQSENHVPAVDSTMFSIGLRHALANGHTLWMK